MGNSAAVMSDMPSNYTNEQKAEIAKLYKEKFDALMATEEGKKMTEADVLKLVQEEYDASQVADTLEPKRATGIIRPKGVDESVPTELKTTHSSRVAFTATTDEAGTNAILETQLRTNMANAKSNEELLKNAKDEDVELAKFISKLNTGQATTESSGFRQRRLSTAQRIEAVESEAPQREKRTTMYAANELGAEETEKFTPFTNAVLGKFSCHGIEPANNPSGVHDKINQDRGCYVYPFNNSEEECLFIVLDGHGQEGDKVSEFAMQQIVVTLETHPMLANNPGSALIDTFETTNRALSATQIQYYSSGCTCVTVLMRGGTLHIANVGDSRAVIGSEKKGRLKAIGLTRDHKPNDPDEKARIVASGGFVSPPPEPGLSSRVWLDAKFKMIGLAMSRSLGDYAVKAVGVTATPEITSHDLTENDKFLVMASDGVWEFISNQEAVDIVQNKIHLGSNVACEELIRIAATRWQHEEGDYRDDITALVVTLPMVRS